MANPTPPDDRSWLPPGQSPTRKFPPTGEEAPSPEALDLERWRLEITGLVQVPNSLTYAEVMSLPQQERTVEVHCVTGWSQRAMRFTGFPLRLLLDRAGVKPTAHFVRFEAYSPRNHDTSLPLGVARDDTWLVHSLDGQPLTPLHGWPLRTFTPSRYFYKSLKWVHVIELLAEDRLGYWERVSSYHNNGDPWPGNERYTTGTLDPEDLERLSNGVMLRMFRQRIIIGASLVGWNPLERDLSGLQLKYCDLRGAQLRGVNLRGANLTNSNLQKADLTGADCSGADLEGADFSGAILRNANLLSTALSGTKFSTVLPDGTVLGAEVLGLRWQRSPKMLEDSEEYLAARVPPVA